MTGIVCEFCGHPIVMTQVELINKRLRECDKCKSYMRSAENATGI